MLLTRRLKRHILSGYEDEPDPEERRTYCGRVVDRQRRIIHSANWDNATCLKCIELAEEDNRKWKHPSHGGKDG